MKLTKPTNAKPESETVAFRAPTALIKEFQSRCDDAGISISEGLRQLLDQFLSNDGSDA